MNICVSILFPIHCTLVCSLERHFLVLTHHVERRVLDMDDLCRVAVTVDVIDISVGANSHLARRQHGPRAAGPHSCRDDAPLGRVFCPMGTTKGFQASCWPAGHPLCVLHDASACFL